MRNNPLPPGTDLPPLTDAEREQHRRDAAAGIHAEWIASLNGLSDEPLRRAAQIALAAIDSLYVRTVPLDAAYEQLQIALSEIDPDRYLPDRLLQDLD